MGDRPTKTEVAPRTEVPAPPESALPEVAPAPPGPTLRHRAAPVARRRRRTVLRWVVGGLVAAAIGTGLVVAWMPQPVPVDLALVAGGPLVVTVDEDGRTRVKDRYVVSAPLAGTVMRSELRSGDSVRRGDIVARVLPLAVPLLDPRERVEAQARLTAARASLRQAETAVVRARAAADFARRDAQRQRVLLQAGATAAQNVEQAELAERTRGEELASAEFGLRVGESEVQVARAALLRLDRLGETRGEEFDVRAPTGGQILRVMQESEGAVQPGATLLEIGDARALEVVVDVLSSDAAEIRPGAPVSIERWGGAAPLRGRVRRVEPSAFTRLSSLGVEEQRVNVIVDLAEPADRRGGLGDGYRVEARIVVWEGANVRQVPAGAVFRHEGGWAVYAVERGVARLRPIEIGRRNGERVQVLRGLQPGEQVVTYPSDNVADGAKVKAR